ncbi:sulfate/molybdate ABC transporter ATP-binding protein [Marinivivus vitaminiproducens]|uniref:sulfate/molybdate ABC transporter ATP-binding protein n=1 Tax=Marinivivus vitaminiproducens TaxID=3035935 RepID=UPI0027988D7B|nr:sulfate ABC transporter ATP-binding protein [Geminicoccaceae bacterium SCSIO 64248]
MTIEVRNITKRFDGFTALDDVSLSVVPGELVALLGPSGSGKTTLLRIIAGLDFQTEGSVLFAGEDATERSVAQRKVGFVFQHYALFRHMTVFENVAFGLRVKPRGERPGEADIKARVTELLELVQIGPFAHRYPTQLSGGQRQRVALARALAIEPRVLLLDEPFGALDAKVRRELRRWLRGLHDRMGLTSVFVTHDQEEALEMADRVVVMREGHIEQEGPPRDIYDQPVSPFVYSFLGDVLVLDGEVRSGAIEVEGQRLADADGRAEGSAVKVFIRPHDLMLARAAADGQHAAVVDAVRTTGPRMRVEATTRVTGRTLEVDLPRGLLGAEELAPGDTVTIAPVRYTVFDASEHTAAEVARAAA